MSVAGWEETKILPSHESLSALLGYVAVKDKEPLKVVGPNRARSFQEQTSPDSQE